MLRERTLHASLGGLDRLPIPFGPVVQSYDGVRRRVLPVLYKALEAGTEDRPYEGSSVDSKCISSFSMLRFCRCSVLHRNATYTYLH
jgi:hypothetical protein